MSTVAESRQVLETVLAAGSIRVLPQGAASPPSVFVAPGNSWLTPSQLAYGSVEVNWVIVCIVSASNEVSISEIDALAQLIMAACRALPNGWGSPVIGAPGILTLAGLPYLAFRAELKGTL
jgi:hypothetical protein